MNHQVPKVSSEELLLSRPFHCELYRLRCHGHSLLLSSYLHRISRKENSACSACGHPLQDLNHLLLDCPASEPLRKSIFGSSLSLFLIYGPDLGVWPDCWCPRSSSLPPSLARGRVVPPPTAQLLKCSRLPDYLQMLNQKHTWLQYGNKLLIMWRCVKSLRSISLCKLNVVLRSHRNTNFFNSLFSRKFTKMDNKKLCLRWLSNWSFPLKDNPRYVNW